MVENKFKNCGFFQNVTDIDSQTKPEIVLNMGIILLLESKEGDIRIHVKLSIIKADKHNQPIGEYTGIVFKIGNDPETKSYAGVSLGDEVDFTKENMRHPCQAPQQKA
jgi:hypothetical protein